MPNKKANYTKGLNKKDQKKTVKDINAKTESLISKRANYTKGLNKKTLDMKFKTKRH